MELWAALEDAGWTIHDGGDFDPNLPKDMVNRVHHSSYATSPKGERFLIMTVAYTEEEFAALK